jgi:tetratricopeptide (TPR) repeat protein
LKPWRLRFILSRPILGFFIFYGLALNFRSLLLAALPLCFWFGSAHADVGLEQSVRRLSDEWSEIFYHAPENQQAEKFKALLKSLGELAGQHPQRAEPIILQAITLCTLAAAEWGLSSLSRISDARALLVKSIDLDPKAMEASAFITLGNLYYRLPGWPISFGDDKQALQYLEAAVKLYPEGLDSNYFLGDYWLEEGEYDKALPYLEKAERAPIRPYQYLSDSKIKEELKRALESARERHGREGNFFSSILPAVDTPTSNSHFAP